MHPAYVAAIDVERPGHLGGGQWHLSRLTAITAVFGKNGSGKSLLLRAIRNANPQKYHYVIPERTGEIEYNAGFLAQQIDPILRRDESQRNFTSQYRQQIIGRIQAYFIARGSTRGGQLPGNPEDLENLLAQLLPDFLMELRGNQNPPYRLTRSTGGAEIRNIDLLSSGEAQLITLGLDILMIAAMWDIQNNDVRLMLVDEPDAHIHPDLQVRFADFLVSVARRYKLQVIVATHSTTFLAAVGQFGADAASIIYLDRTKNTFRAEPFTKVLKELTACLGGHALMGPLFGTPLLLVEGDDDYRIWSQVPRHHVTSFSVLPSNGNEMKDFQRALERIFSALRDEAAIPVGFALIDGDKGKPERNAETPQDHIRYVQLNCHEAENLYLTNDVLALLNTNWNDAAKKIAAEAGNWGDKANRLGQAEAWDRKLVDLKGIIEEVSRILDAKGVHWTIRTAAAIGRSRPKEQLHDFLGAEVVDALWGPAG